AQMRQYYSGFANYQWCREYYWSINGSDPSKAENWTQKAFNPFVVCNLPPMITEFSVEAHEEWCGIIVTACYLTVTVKVKSITGLGQVYIGVRALNSDTTSATWVGVIWSATQTEASYTGIRLDVDWWTLKLTGYSTQVIVLAYVEVGGKYPSVSAEHQIKGIVTIFAEAIANLIAMLTGGLQKVWDAVESAVNAIVEWVKGIIQKILEPLFSPIKSAISSWIESIKDALSKIGMDEGPTQYTEEQRAFLLAAIFSATVPFLLLSLVLALMALQWFLTAIGVVTGGASIGIGKIIAVAVNVGIQTVRNMFLELVAGFTIGAFVAVVLQALPTWVSIEANTLALVVGLLYTFEKFHSEYGKFWQPL
ncbi:MAG: hypothetical protein ACP5LE_08060, partial [Thermoplasmata archaeon]